ncbi:MAG: host attachment protein [Rhodovarius sp.]|nr:host attachment protein [Rhodovarius sp.]MCX7932351.1 host attachment protein [Rhodovarius sp.]MDW8314972.1 host attachment protein [Rhodovarius sp.]
MDRPITWYVVADAGRAEALVKRRHESGFDTVRTWENPLAHLKAHDLGSDKPGRAFDSLGAHRSAMEPHENPKDVSERNFARELADALAAAVAAGEVERIVLIAAPRLLGMIRPLLSPAVTAVIHSEHAKDYTKLPRADLFARLNELRPVGG